MTDFVSRKGVKKLWKRIMAYFSTEKAGIVNEARQSTLDNVPLAFDGIVDDDITVQSQSTVNYTSVLWSSKKRVFVAKGSDGLYYSNWGKTDRYGAMDDYISARLYVLTSSTTASVLGINNSVYARVRVKNALGGEWVMRLMKVGEVNTSGGSTTVDVDAKDIIGTVKLSELDALGVGEDELNDTILGNNGSYFRVTYEGGPLVGVLQIFSDNLGHSVTQVLTTHYVLEGGEISGTHDDNRIFTYYRSYGRPDASGNLTAGEWTQWSELLATTMYNGLMSKEDKVKLAGIATGATADSELSDEEIDAAIAEAMEEQGS